MVYQGNARANGLLPWTSEDLSFTGGTYPAAAQNRIEATALEAAGDFPAMSNDYQQIVIPGSREISIATDAGRERGFIQVADTNAYLPGTFAGNEILDWMKGPDSTNTVGNNGGGGKKQYQTIAIEPLHSAPGVVAADRGIGEYKFDAIHPQPVWYEWLKPSQVLKIWVVFWTTETSATPVVLMLVRF
jgi:hypothetical protein